MKANPKYMKDLLALYVEKLAFEIGDFSYGEKPLIWWWGEKAKLKMGRFCSLACNVHIYLGGNHRTDWITTYPFSASPFNETWPEAKDVKGHPATKGDVVIGNDVWLANDCVILSGVTIGDGAVVAARSVVTKDIPPYAIVSGNPARIIRSRFSDEEIAMLLKLAWWNWDTPRIKENIEYLCSNRIRELWEKESG